MLTINKTSDQPLTYQINLQEALDATYQVSNVSYTPNVGENSAKITLNLEKISDTSATFNYSFPQVMDELNGNTNMTIKISTVNANGQIITHQETGTHIERPVPKKEW
ncbi:MAG: hypothetical protein IT258_14865 [Saprospiraceae bacterium]|nr:hypothetical protein [Saprospiraceae bacterium]